MDKPFLDTKLRPAVNGHSLPRQRLFDGLSHNISKKLVLLVSYEGTGKTTLMAQWLNRQSLKAVWYNLDHYDRDPATFFQYLVRGIQEHYPQFWKSLDPSELSSNQIWPVFLEEIQKVIQEPLHIVLDNYECIRGVKRINQFVVYLLQHQPPSIRLAILSRQMPGFHLTGHRLREELYQVGADDLAFDLDEACRLFSQIFQLYMPQSTIDQIVRETQGWALALVLCAQSMGVRTETRGRKQKAFEISHKYKDNLHAYFLEEILKGQPENVQELLISSAMLPLLSPDELGGFLGQSEAKRFWNVITGSRIPTAPVNGSSGSYRYHRLFQEFLLKKMRERKSDQEVASLHLKAANTLRKNYPEEAIEHYVKASFPDEAATLLETLGWDLLRKGRFETLKLLLNRIPPASRSRNPVLNYFLGRTQEISGDMDGSQIFYQKALSQLSEDATNVKAACQERLGIIEIERDRFSKATSILSRTLDQLEHAEIRKETVRRLVATHASMAKAYCKLEEGDWTASHLKKARSLFELYGEPTDGVSLLQAETLEFVVTGEFKKAVRSGVEGKDLCLQLGFEGHIPLFDHYLSFSNLYMGHFAEAETLAREGLEILQRQGVRDNVYGALESDLGHCALAGGDTQAAIERLRESSEIFRRSWNFCGQFWNDCAICLTAARERDLSSAWEFWRMMERNSRKLSLPMQHAMTLTVEAFLSALEQIPERTIERLSEAGPFLEKSRQKMSVLQALVLRIRSYLTIGRDDLAEETLSRVFALGSLTDLYYSVHFDLDWFSPFAERFLKNNPDLDHLWAPARSLVKSKQPGDKQKAPTRFSVNGSQSDKDLLDLHVYSLGPFRIFANGREVALGECQSKKALKLLKYLFFRRHESGIILDEALELLWPGMNPEVTRPNLRVILSMLRKVFKNPKIGENGFPNLMREGNRLILSLGRNGWADVDEFMGQIKLAEYKERRGLWSDALSHYKKTASLYYGDFISDEPYADWCSMEREYLRDQFLTALFRMADCQERLGDLSAAISTLYHLLKLDRYREDAYRRLMHLCFSAGRKGEIIRVYDLCRKNIEEDLGVNLSEDTLDLYRNLCGSSNRTVMTDLLGSTGTRGSTRTYVRL